MDTLSQTQFELQVRYGAPVFEARRRLQILPLRRVGQIVRREEITTFPPPDTSEIANVDFGNRCLMLHHLQIEREFRLTLELEVETNGNPLPEAQPDFVRWKMPSRVVIFVPELQTVARQAKAMPPLERAAHFGRFCYLSLDYEAQTSDMPLKSDAIWARKRGNCADFAHVFLSLCRCSGFPARYVAGFNPTQGQMHAWAEVWIEGLWHAYDPTLGRAAAPGSVAVAVGRDFFDCAPHTGTYRGVARAEISLFCRTTTQKTRPER